MRSAPPRRRLAMSSLNDLIHSLQYTTEADRVCSDDLVKDPWAFDAPLMTSPCYGPGASQNDIIPQDSPIQTIPPEEYRLASRDELDARITGVRGRMGDRLTILGHLYQRDEIVKHADFLGDSFQLAQQSLQRPSAEFIVFCGVHFMAETADILSRPDQRVILPNLAAGCSMADLADLASVTSCWSQLHAGDDATLTIPITYMNSSAALKAFCGENEGIVCTSSNAKKVMSWALTRGNRVLFFPDQHLGRNTAKALGIPSEDMVVWDPRRRLGGNSLTQLQSANVILWKGHCSVHMRFTPYQIDVIRAEHPGAKIFVHPECAIEVVDLADFVGSTTELASEIAKQPAGTTVAVGTEANMVQRLAQQHPHLNIRSLEDRICPCSTMYRIHPAYLAWVLEAAERREVVNEVRVSRDIAISARKSLDRMLEVAS